MENLQAEVQEMEFLQFSKGLSFMRKEDFAEWLLFFTNTENKDVYWKNVREKLSAGESISLEGSSHFVILQPTRKTLLLPCRCLV